MIKHVSLIILIFTLFVCSANAQFEEFWPRLLVPLRISDGSATIYDTLGCDPLATYCIDLFIDTNLVEEELPMFPPPVFEARFIDHRPGSICLGNGTRLHIQDFGFDTFRLRIIQPNSSGYPIQISWSYLDYGLAYWSSLKIGDSRQLPTSYVNMRTETTMVINDPTLTTVDIIGISAIDPVEETRPHIPEALILLQNYPNPFNSSTTISYYLPFRSFINISIYDLLGRNVDRLVDGYQMPGLHSTQYDASELPSGIYVAHLSSSSSQLSIKVLHIK